MSSQGKPVEPKLLRINKHYRVYRDGRIETELKQGRPKADGTPCVGEWHAVKVATIGRGKKTKGPIGFEIRSRGRVERYPVALAVLMCYGDPRPSDDAEPVHKDGDRTNCAIDNLGWAVPSESPAAKARANVERWMDYYACVRDHTMTAEEICRKERVSLAEAINRLRVAKREFEKLCRSETRRENAIERRMAASSSASASGAPPTSAS